MPAVAKNLFLRSIVLVVCPFLVASSWAKHDAALYVGSKAPGFKVGKWYHGTPISALKTGHIYVVEFWATRCGPCVEGIPHLSALAKRYAGKVEFAAVSVQKWQDGSPNDTLNLVSAFMKTPTGKAMHYNVAADTSTGFMVKSWMAPAGFDAIPCSFVVDKTGRIAWMGSPHDLDPILAKIAG